MNPDTAPGTVTPTTRQGTPTKVREKKPETFCLFCGMPISREELGITVQDERASEWNTKGFVNVTIHGCDACWAERKAWLEAGIRGADERKETRIAALGNKFC